MTVLEMSNSELRLFTRCPRAWMLAYYLGYRTDESHASPTGVAHLGSMVHLAFEAYYGYDIDPLDVLKLEYNLLSNERPEYDKEIKSEWDMAAKMIEGYLDWAAETGTDVGLTVVDTEHFIAHPIGVLRGVEVALRAKLDQLIRRDHDEALLLRDWKTVGNFTKANDLAIDPQMRRYALLQALRGKDTGKRADGVLYTMLKRSKRTARATGPFYQQQTVWYNRHDLNNEWLHVRAVATRVVEARQRLEDGEDHHSVCYPNPSDYCSWGCPFYSMCPMMDDGSRAWDALDRNFVKGDPYGYYSGEAIDRVREHLGGRKD